MKLRSSDHSHYIKTAKGGLVAQVWNISNGRPSLVFKRVEDIYENTKMLRSCSVFKAKSKVDCLAVDSDAQKNQNQCAPVVHRRFIEVTESSGLKCSTGVERGDDDLEDTGFGDITLKQLKKRCTGKKRKYRTNSDLTEEIAETCSHLKQDYINIQVEEDEHDLTMPLSCLKSKVSKKKAKRKSMKNCSSALLEGIKSIVKSEEFYYPEEQLQGGVPAPTDIKATGSTSDYSDGQEAICVGDDSSVGCNGLDEVEVEIPELVHREAQSMISVAGNSSEGCNENADYSCNEIPASDSLNAQIIISYAEDSAVGCAENLGCSAVEISNSDDSDSQISTHVPDYSSENCNETVSCSLNEIPEFDCFEAESAIHVPGDSPLGCNQNADSRGFEVIESNRSNGNKMICIAGDSSFSSFENQVEAPEADLSHADNMFCVASESLSGCKEMECNGVISSTVLDAADECILEEEAALSFLTEPQSCLSDECNEYMEPADCKLLPPESSMGIETTWKQNAESINHLCPELLVPECKNEAVQIPNNLSSDTISQMDRSEMFDISQNYPSMMNMSWLANSEPEIEVPDIAIGISLKHIELSDGVAHARCTFEKGSEVEQLTNVEANAISVPFRSMPDSSASIGNDLVMTEEKQPTCDHGCLASVDNNFPAAKETELLSPTIPDASKDSPKCNPSAVTDDHEGLPGNRNCEDIQLQHAPKRLFSARKSICPTSQKRLCKALESDGCCHNEPHGCELCSAKKTANGISRIGDPKQIRTESAVSTSPKTKNPKDGKKGSPPKRKLKVSLHSRAIPSLSSGCDSIQICSENAIAFSQQQMRDIERITTRLTEELRTMKDIVEESLCSQTSPTKSPKSDANEVRVAIANAEKAEETTQRWLTMMTKDCKRFCKIMSLTEKSSVASRNEVQAQCLTEKGSVASSNAVNKERKKITFADETGGKLCHVKIFDNEVASLEEPSCDKPELLAA